MNIKFAISVVAAGLFVGLAGSVWLLTGKLHDVRAERDAARTELSMAYRAIDALAAERAAADRRADIVQASRETILAAPDTDDGPVTPVLLQALEAADRIGDIR